MTNDEMEARFEAWADREGYGLLIRANQIGGLAEAALVTWQACHAEMHGEDVVRDGWKLAMRVMQSSLYHDLPEEERGICDALIAENPYMATIGERHG